MASPPYNKADVEQILRELDLGSSVAEEDHLLDTARVDTSVGTDLYNDRVDLIPGTKGSGKSALYLIFVNFLPDLLLRERKVVVAHGIASHGDNVFHAFKNEFATLDEDAFVDFWCIYLVSLAHEHFIKGDRYVEYLSQCANEVERFREACQRARIPEVAAKKSLRSVLAWALNAVKGLHPKVMYDTKAETITVSLFPAPPPAVSGEPAPDSEPVLPRYIGEVTDALVAILSKADLHLWLMIDRLDEIFPRRSALETRALRGLLRTLRIFASDRIRVKVFLRDDILEQITGGGEGFTALTHITARAADRLQWSEDQILTMVVKRLFASASLLEFLGIDPNRLTASKEYEKECFYRVFPPTVHRGSNQSPTLRWIYNHTMDGRGVVTPRDVIDLLTKARQRQIDEYSADPTGTTNWIIGPSAIIYGLAELSKRKRTTYLRAEFPHFWPHIEKLVKGKTEYSQQALERLLGYKGKAVIPDLVSIGLLSEINRNGAKAYQIPFVYREGLELTRGRVD